MERIAFIRVSKSRAPVTPVVRQVVFTLLDAAVFQVVRMKFLHEESFKFVNNADILYILCSVNTTENPT